MRMRNQFDEFVSNNPNTNRGLSPRHRLTNVTNYQSNPYHQQKNISPNRISQTRKPMISPVRSPRPASKQTVIQQPVVPKQQLVRQNMPFVNQGQSEFFCANENHRGKKAEYMIHIEQEDMYYCGVCATQAASQGFTVNKIHAQPKQHKVLPRYPQYHNNRKAQELAGLMEKIIILEEEFKKGDPKKVREHYLSQEDLLNQFYDQMAALVERMRSDHMNDLKNEENSNRQLSQMHYENLKLHMDELNEAWDDMEQNFEDVAERIDQEQFEAGMRTYNNTIQMFKIKMEEYNEINRQFTSYSPQELQEKVEVFEEKLENLWQEGKATDISNMSTKKYIAIPEKQEKAVSLVRGGPSVKNMHEKLPHSGVQRNCEGQVAFRNIFPDEQSETQIPAPSPQFKNI